MKNLVYILTIFILGCSHNTKNGSTTSSYTYSIDSIDITVFVSDSMKNQIFPNNYKVVNTEISEIVECETLLKTYIAQYNQRGILRADSLNKRHRIKYSSEAIDVEQFLIDLKNYGRQYISAIDNRNHKLVYINCFCNPLEFPYRHKDWVFVFDGGNCFFQLKIDLTDKKVIDFSENGVA